jgi:hypothetical protein
MMRWLKRFWNRNVIGDDPYQFQEIGEAFVEQVLHYQCPGCRGARFSYQYIAHKQRVVVHCDGCKRSYWLDNSVAGVTLVNVERANGNGEQ